MAHCDKPSSQSYLYINLFIVNLAGGMEQMTTTVGAIILLAHDLHMHVIAEGVETEEQRDYLRLRGRDETQGHYVSRALPGVEPAPDPA
jgi:EAL domain-containing protein (putative c-di-GMP-specific phosphodiesterase class I)